jgi:hypothetical protein
MGWRHNYTPAPAPAPKTSGFTAEEIVAEIEQYPTPKVTDALANTMLDAAQCLDDCLVRIYPEEFDMQSKINAAIRFGEGRGTISRIATIADKLRSLAQRAGEMERKFGFTYCAYCGELFEIDAPESVDAVGKHIGICPKHPMRTVEKERDEWKQRAGEGYTVEEIRAYLEGKMICGIDMDRFPQNTQLGIARDELENPLCGIAAVTNKKENHV